MYLFTSCALVKSFVSFAVKYVMRLTTKDIKDFTKVKEGGKYFKN